MVSALFFDFDGLILDTETPEVMAWNWLFESYGHEYPDHVWMNIVGRGPDQVAEQPEILLKRLASLEESPESIRLRFRGTLPSRLRAGVSSSAAGRCG